MRVVVQRCTRAEVRIDGISVGRIDKGFLLLVGFSETDTQAEADLLAKKIAQLRIFEDTEGKMNLALSDVAGAILSISQFTLFADCRKGNRPSFIRAARPEQAEPLYDYFNNVLREQYSLHVETGRFGADMKVDFINDGPVTILLDTDELIVPRSGNKPSDNNPISAIQTRPQPTSKTEERIFKLILAVGKQSLPRRQIIADLGLKQHSRKSLLENYLWPAHEHGYIEFSYPNSPHKPEQTYKLTAKGLDLYLQLTQ